MGNKRFEDITSDYYCDNWSYVKTILDLLPDGVTTEVKKVCINGIVNDVIKNMNEEERVQYRRTSRKFNEKLALSSKYDVSLYVEFIYKIYLEMLLSSTIDKQKDCFKRMNDCVTWYVDYVGVKTYNFHGDIHSTGRSR